MKVLITGATGFVGTSLVRALCAGQHDVVVLSRNVDRAKVHFGLPLEYHEWDPLANDLDLAVFEGVEAVVNLMGESVADKRWSDEQKKMIRDSRVIGTKRLIDALNAAGKPLETFIQASATGFYERGRDEGLDESSRRGTGFLADVCVDWEKESLRVKDVGRHVILRIGLVLGLGHSALQKMLPAFQMGVGGALGNGRQWMSWIHLDDLVGLILAALLDERFSGIYNAVSPQPVRNKEFTRILASVLKKPAFIPVPQLPVKVAMGERASLVFDSQRVLPKRYKDTSFVYQHEFLPDALDDLLTTKEYDGVPAHYPCQIYSDTCWVPQSVAEVFDFFSDAKNLEEITPPWLNFQVLSQSTPTIGQGTRFEYKLRVRGMPLKWRSLILDWEHEKQFVDVQLNGPYHIWHHRHGFQSYKGGTLMTDTVHFALPRVPIIKQLLSFFVRQDVQRIFAYRRSTILSKFCS